MTNELDVVVGDVYKWIEDYDQPSNTTVDVSKI